jgi:Cu/Ag efflux protein CusF
MGGEQPDYHARPEDHHPKGWSFTLPQGDPSKSRQVFIKFACFACHRVAGEDFPDPGAAAVGPELSQMGAMHPLEFFAESVMNPDAVILNERDIGEDGRSMMRAFNKLMTVQELIDLSAYLASLRPLVMPKSVTGEGKVITVVPNSDSLVVEHGGIQGFMGAMTMGYKVDPPSLLKGLKPGDKIRFTLDTEKRAIVKIVKLKN